MAEKLADRVRAWLEVGKAKEPPPPVLKTLPEERAKSIQLIGWTGQEMPSMLTCGPQPVFPLSSLGLGSGEVSRVSSTADPVSHDWAAIQVSQAAVKPKEESKLANDEVFEDDEKEEEGESEEDDSEEDESEDDESEEDESEEGESQDDDEADEPEKKPRIRPDGSPERFAVRKLLRKPQLRKDGSVFKKPVIANLDEYEAYIPNAKDIEANLVPLYGGGSYLVINLRTKKLVKKFQFPGEERDPDQEDGMMPAAPLQGQPSMVSQVGNAVQVPNLGQAALQPIDKVSQALASGQGRAVEQLAVLAEKFVEAGDTEQLAIAMNCLKEIATGRKEATAQDKFMEMMVADRTMLMEALFKGRGKETSSSEIVRETIGTMKDMFSMARDMMPGEDTSVQMVKEVGGMVQNSLKEVTDTLVTVTGSKGDLKPKDEMAEPVYRCERCKGIVQPTWKLCPNCGLVFKAGLKPAPEPPPPPPAPSLPPEIKAKIGYLRRLAVMIKQNHDPEQKGKALFRFADPEEKLMLLFTAEFGYDNLMRLATPYRASTEIPEVGAIFDIIESANGKLWIGRLFRSIRATASEDSISLAPPVREKFLEQLNAYSPVKFKMRPEAKTVIQGEKKGPLRREKVEQVSESPGPDDHTTSCPICNALMPVSQLKTHLFTAHPRVPKQPTAPVANGQTPAPISTLTGEGGPDWPTDGTGED